jgi:hypothetical protein
MNTWWTKPEYIRERKAFIRRNPVCVRCGRSATTPGHSAADYSSYETYLWVVVNDMADPLCNACNLCERKGLRPCPACVREKKLKIRYIRPEQEYCYDHRPEAEKVKSRERKEVFKQLVKQSHSIQNAKRRKIYQEMKRGNNNPQR